LDGQRKIDIRPYYRALHNVKVGDMIEYINIETQESVIREVKGIALFNDFNTMIKMLPPELIGYQTREEIKLRIERMYPQSEQDEFGVCALFIDEPSVRRMMKLNSLERAA
jgi:ASC-1-like (ASCH) protein